MKNTTAQKMANKAASNAGKSPDRKNPKNLQKKAGTGAQNDDDDSVDSYGNIRDLIAYDSDSCSGTVDTELTPDDRLVIKRTARVAALKAREKIKARLKAEESSESSPPPTRKSRGFAPRRRPTVDVESEDSPVVSRRSKKKQVVESESEEEAPVKRRAAPTKKKVVEKVVEKVEEEEEEDDEEDEEEEGEEEEEEEDDDEYEDEDEKAPGGFVITMGGYPEEEDRNVPKRHNMKKESDVVKKFVKLVTEPVDAGGIDEQIDEFKRLTSEKQTEIISVLERRPDSDPNYQSMMFKILSMNLPNDTRAMVLAKYNTLQVMDPGAGEYYKLRSWLEKVTALPLGLYKDVPVRIADGQELCGAFMEKAHRALSEAIYGQEESKLQILQFIASKIANPSARGLSLLLSGPPGIGKTSLIKNGIAKAINWPFQFISLGGDSDASTYVGHQLVYEGSHCGKIVNSLITSK